MAIPRHGAYAVAVAAHGAELLALRVIPELNIAFLRADCQVLATLSPTNRGDHIIVAKLTQLHDTACVIAPVVDATTKAHG